MCIRDRPRNTAFFGQTTPNTGVDENGVIELHPGFLPVPSGGILADPSFAAGDFTAAGYTVMTVCVALEGDEDRCAPPPAPAPAPPAPAPAPPVRGTVYVTNNAPMQGTCQTPVWVGVHDGSFDLYDRGAPISAALEPLAEDGNNAPIIADFAEAAGGVFDGTVGGAPICPGETVELPFEFALVPGVTHYFSYASMILPSNDAFVANGNPKAHPIFTAGGDFANTLFTVGGDEVLDAGSEVNDEKPRNTAFFGQTTPNTGVDENGVIELHPGFLPVRSGGILADPSFAAGDFTAAGYTVMTVCVALELSLIHISEPTRPY